MDKYPFLSTEWIDKVRELRKEYVDTNGIPATDTSIRMNQIVTEVPFGGGELATYIDTTSGFVDIEMGQLEDADITIRIDYNTAKAIFVEMDAQVAMSAFMQGKIKVTGDFTKLVALQGQFAPGESNPQVMIDLLKEITA
ncbi:MAG: SCP2 sterol-binding domain-containing protein [Actinomycetota bacterium]|nr:SCP2 sterol-binding domain-containing protein [Actinomycetota bacterium]